MNGRNGIAKWKQLWNSPQVVSESAGPVDRLGQIFGSLELSSVKALMQVSQLANLDATSQSAAYEDCSEHKLWSVPLFWDLGVMGLPRFDNLKTIRKQNRLNFGTQILCTPNPEIWFYPLGNRI